MRASDQMRANKNAIQNVGPQKQKSCIANGKGSYSMEGDYSIPHEGLQHL